MLNADQLHLESNDDSVLRQRLRKRQRRVSRKGADVQDTLRTAQPAGRQRTAWYLVIGTRANNCEPPGAGSSRHAFVLRSLDLECNHRTPRALLSCLT